MSQRTEPMEDEPSGLRAEVVWLVVEIGALFVLFIVAFTGRDHFSDTVKTGLSVLSVAAGFLGVVGGAIIIRRGIAHAPTLKWRLPLGGLMVFLGGYTIVHILG